MAAAEDVESKASEDGDEQDEELVAVTGSKTSPRKHPYFHAPDCNQIDSDPQTMSRRDARSAGLRPSPNCGCLNTEGNDD